MTAMAPVPLLLTSVLLLSMYTTPCSTATPVLTLNPVDGSEAETLAQEKILTTVTIAPQTDTVTCQLKKSTGTTLPFALWIKEPATEYSLYYVPSLGKLSSSSSPYSLTVSCSDQLGNSQDVTFKLNVTGNTPPSFTSAADSTTLDVSSAKVGTKLEGSPAVNEDGDLLTYGLNTSFPYSSYFTIDTQTGVVSVARDPRGLDVDKVVLQRYVSDGKASATQNITVNLLNPNKAPTVTAKDDFIEVLETADTNEVIATFTASETGVTPSCAVTSPQHEGSKFQFTGTTTKTLKLASANLLDYMVTPYYTVTCTASDGFLSSTSTFTVTVLDKNEPPVFDKSIYQCSLYESEAGVSRCKLSITTKDPEADAYTLYLQSSTTSARFVFDPVKKEITFKNDYDVDSQALPALEELTLVAEDARGAKGKVPIKVTIADINDNAPVIQNVPDVTINEGDSIQTIASLIATDADLTSPNHNVSFSLDGCSPASCLSYFSVLGDQVHYHRSITGIRSDTTFSLQLRATDKGNPSQTSTKSMIVRYIVTTTTSTTTTTTTTPRTAAVVVNNANSGSSSSGSSSSSSSSGFFDQPGNVALLATTLALLALGALAAILACCGCCSAGGACDCGGESGGNCFRSRAVTPPRRMEPVQEVRRVRPVEEYDDNYFRTSQPSKKANSDYKDPFWRDGDEFETGRHAGRRGFSSSRPTPLSDRSMVLTPSNLSFDY